jgi:hypothetical protein
MARIARVVVPGLPHHITHCGYAAFQSARARSKVTGFAALNPSYALSANPAVLVAMMLIERYRIDTQRFVLGSNS